MTAAQNPERYLGRTAVDNEGGKIGTIGQVYLNDETGQPDWVTVNTGLFGTKENFVPLEGSTFSSGDDVVLPFGKDVVKDAPHVGDASHLDVDEQDSLYSYYHQYIGAGRTQTGGTQTTGTVGSQTDYAQTSSGQGSATSGAGHDTSGPNTDEAMTRSEEHLNVGTQRVEAGRARLRKFVTTEQQSVDVPVSHEEVRVEREPITDANRGAALDGPAISEEEHEVVLHADQPVVTTEAVPVERVRLGTETVTENQTVSGEVRKEQVEVDDAASARSDNR
jgi:uncharacterized protein (TIGR02271 family)